MKKWTKVLCCVLMIGFFAVCTLTGCATVGNIKNTYNEVIYNGNSAVMVGNHLYYGNGFADIGEFSSDGDYKANINKSFLARLDTKNLKAKNEDFSPKNVENVSSEVVGYKNTFMFVLGQQIYYATPNRQKVSTGGETKNDYSYTCIYTSKLNGDSKKKLYTTTAEISKIEVLKTEGTYYIVMLAGDKLIKINLSNNKSQVIAEGVSSVALPKTFQKDKIGSTLNWNGEIYFTTALKVESGSGRNGNILNKIKLSGGKAEEIYNQGTTLSLIGREKDVVFFTEKTGSFETETYVADFSNSTNFNKEKFQSSSSISDIKLISAKTEEGERDLGYVYSVGSNVGFKILGGKSGVVSFQNQGEELSSFKILFVTGRTIYLSTTTGIYRAELSNVFNGISTTVNVETVVTMKAIYDGSFYAFDGSYIYYFAQLEEVEIDENEEEDKEPETDENYYLYRAKVGGENSYQLLGQTVINSRRS